MSKIPVVQEEIKYSIFRTIEGFKKREKGKKEYLEEFWKDFKTTQPHLARIVLKEMEAFDSVDKMGAFAHGVWLIYAALQSQEEADEMNSMWG